MSKLTVARALTARIGFRAVRFVTILLAIIAALWLVLTIGLVYSFTPWWWLLLVPMIVVVLVFSVIRLLIRFILRRIHTEQMTAEQRQALDTFVDTIQELLEARATPPWVFALICIKDLLLHRDITTIKSIISSTASLRRDYQSLEKLF